MNMPRLQMAAAQDLRRLAKLIWRVPHRLLLIVAPVLRPIFLAREAAETVDSENAPDAELT
jgi:hypothetical protein